MFEKKQTDVNELMVLDSLADACLATIEGYPTTVGGRAFMLRTAVPFFFFPS